MLQLFFDWVENIVERRENAGCQHFLFFPTMISTRPKAKFNFSHLFCCLQMLSIWRSLKIFRLVKDLKNWFVCYRVNPSQRNLCFYLSAAQVFRKPLWEKEKLLLRNNIFSFSTLFKNYTFL